jgi:hypothetical protein
MSNRLSRDTEEAAKVLAAFRDKYHPHETLQEKLSAAEDLRAKLVSVTSGVRQWTVKSVGEDTLIALKGAGTVQVHTDPKTGRLQLSADGKHWQSPALEYDVFNHEWIGSEVDPDIVIPAGEPAPKKAALVAVAEKLVQLLGDQD